MCQVISEGKEFDFNHEDVGAILDEHGRERSKLVPILHDIQAKYSFLPEKVMMMVAEELNIPPVSVFGVATFYAHFTLTPKGKYVVKVCNGTACYVKKSTEIIKAIENTLNLSGAKPTSDDMLFTLEPVACLGCCGLAPVIVVNEDVHGNVSTESTIGIINKIREEEAANV